jgi:uncharacterized protein HemY
MRQELVLTAARHDADLAYQMLRSTQSLTANNAGNGRRFPVDPQSNLEQNLLAAIAASDPKVAYQKANESLDKGEYPTALARVLGQLQAKDPEAFKKLSDKTLSRLGSDSLLASREATSLAMSLLMPGPRVNASTSADANKSATNTAQVLNESAYHELMDNAVTASLNVTSLGQGNMNRGGGGRGPFRAAQQNPQSTTSQNTADDTQVRQNNARMLLFGLSTMLPQIDQYLPERAPALRQKLTDLGMGSNAMMNYGNQIRTAMQQGTSDSLEAAAKVAPPQIQSRLYQQAAQKAVDEGNTDRALQIANDHLDESGRNSIMQAVDFKRMATDASPEKLNDIKLKLAALPSDSDRVKYLIELATATQKDNAKLALRFLEDARALVSRRATNFKEFEDQLQVADAFAPLDPKRSFDVLELGIAQLNELLAAAQVLNGFEVDVFRDGELPLQGGSDLGNMIARYGQELAALAKIDFDRARITADRFQLAEPRLLAKLSIVQVAFGVQPTVVNNNRRRQDFQFLVR